MGSRRKKIVIKEAFPLCPKGPKHELSRQKNFSSFYEDKLALTAQHIIRDNKANIFWFLTLFTCEWRVSEKHLLLLL